MSYKDRPASPVPPLKQILQSPCTGQSIWPDQCCPGFSARKNGKQRVEPVCRFCKYADFSPKGPGIPEVGICHYPEEQTDTPAGRAGEA